MNKIYIHCDGGFGNRFNTLFFGLYFCRKFSYFPIVIWPTNNWCGADFDDLFDMNISSLKSMKNLNFKNTFNLIHENYLNFSDFTSIYSIKNINELKSISNEKDIFYTHSTIPWNLIEDQNIFKNTIKNIKFKTNLIECSNNIIKENTNNENFYGIHLRKTDFGNRSETAEIELLKLVKQNQSKKFFICSDDEKTENLFTENKNVFKNKKLNYVKKMVDGDWNNAVDSNNNKIEYNVNRSRESVIESIIDLIILSKSTIISPDVGSTFHQCAKILKESYV